MTNEQIVGTAFEYASIHTLTSTLANDMQKLISLMRMHKRPDDELIKMSQVLLLLNEYHYTYTLSGLNKFIQLNTK